jgi:hypothetical protein
VAVASSCLVAAVRRTAVVVEEGEEREVGEARVAQVLDIVNKRVQVHRELAASNAEVDHRFERVEQRVELGRDVEHAVAGAWVVEEHRRPEHEEVQAEEDEEDEHIGAEEPLHHEGEDAKLLGRHEEIGDELPHTAAPSSAHGVNMNARSLRGSRRTHATRGVGAMAFRVRGFRATAVRVRLRTCENSR